MASPILVDVLNRNAERREASTNGQPPTPRTNGNVQAAEVAIGTGDVCSASVPETPSPRDALRQDRNGDSMPTLVELFPLRSFVSTEDRGELSRASAESASALRVNLKEPSCALKAFGRSDAVAGNRLGFLRAVSSYWLQRFWRILLTPTQCRRSLTP